MKVLRLIGVVMAICFAPNAACASWTVTILGVGQASVILSTTGEEHVGYVTQGNTDHAALWNEQGFNDLNPIGATASYSQATSGTQQAGYAYFGNGLPKAGFWSGSANSWVNLNPLGAIHSQVFATIGSQQGGTAAIGNEAHAGIWSGTVASWIDLNPAGSSSSFVKAISGNQQAGWAYFGNGYRAGIWTGAASSWVELHPAGASSSYAYDTAETQQAGVAYFGSNPHAGIWSSISNSWIDLNPTGAESSEANATTGRFQAGRVFNPSKSAFQHAGIWHGTAASWFDLHPFLPQGATYSVAYDLSEQNSNLFVVGMANINGVTCGVLWVGTTNDIYAQTNPPVITQPPLSRTLSAGASTLLSFRLTGDGPFSYQWRLNSSPVSGATNPMLTLNGVTAVQAGRYDVVVTGAVGVVTSSPASVALFGLEMVQSSGPRLPLLTLDCAPGTSFRLEHSWNLTPTNWSLLAPVTLSGSRFNFVDLPDTNRSMWFYRAVPQ